MENQAQEIETESPEPQTAIQMIESSKAVQEVQASLVIAKRFPRNEIQAETRILRECQRFDLAKIATYKYPRGGSSVTGPSIRLAEVVARHWGNIDYGFRQLELGNGRSMFEAFCWDKETNTRATRTFFVEHFMQLKNGSKKMLTDPRDVYEIGANQSQRRVRACILEIIPGYVLDKAQEQCRETLKKGEKSEPLVDRVARIAKAFQERFGVSIPMLERRCGKTLSDLSHEEFVDLWEIFNSLDQGNSKKHEWFDCKPTDVSRASDLDKVFDETTSLGEVGVVTE